MDHGYSDLSELATSNNWQSRFAARHSERRTGDTAKGPSRFLVLIVGILVLAVSRRKGWRSDGGSSDPKARPTMDPQGIPATSIAQVDQAALSIAVMAFATAFILGDGDWGPLSLVVGATLLLIIVGYHRTAPGVAAWRRHLLSAVHVSTLALSTGILLAWPIQEQMVRGHFEEFDAQGRSLAADQTTEIIACIWAVVAVLFLLHMLVGRVKKIRTHSHSATASTATDE